MDPKLRQALQALLPSLQQSNPAVAAEVTRLLKDGVPLSERTVALLRPAIASAGIDPSTIPVNTPLRPTAPQPGPSMAPPKSVPLPGPTGGGLRDERGDNVPVDTPAQGQAPTASQLVQQYLGAQGGGRDERTTADQISGAPSTSTTTAPPTLLGSQGGLRDENTTIEQISGAPTGAPGGGGGPAGNGSGWATTTGIGLAGDDNGAVRFALQEAGLNPDRLGHFGNIIARALAPMILARRNTVGLTGSGNTGTIPQELADFTKMFTTKGVDAFGEAAKYGQSILNSPGLAGYLKNITSGEDQGQFYQGLLPLLYGGANPLIQQAAADASQRYLNQYRDAELRGGGVQPGGGVFSTWLDTQPNVDPFVRRIFGR